MYKCGGIAVCALLVAHGGRGFHSGFLDLVLFFKKNISYYASLLRLYIREVIDRNGVSLIPNPNDRATALV